MKTKFLETDKVWVGLLYAKQYLKKKQKHCHFFMVGPWSFRSDSFFSWFYIFTLFLPIIINFDLTK